MIRKITSIDAFEQLVENTNEFYFLKHSNTCPISLKAYEDFEKFHYERDMHGFYLIVQDHRELSNYIAQKYDIKHESPQAFYITRDGVKWNASHSNITVTSLSQAED